MTMEMSELRALDTCCPMNVTLNGPKVNLIYTVVYYSRYQHIWYILAALLNSLHSQRMHLICSQNDLCSFYIIKKIVFYLDWSFCLSISLHFILLKKIVLVENEMIQAFLSSSKLLINIFAFTLCMGLF